MIKKIVDTKLILKYSFTLLVIIVSNFTVASTTYIHCMSLQTHEYDLNHIYGSSHINVGVLIQNFAINFDLQG